MSAGIGELFETIVSVFTELCGWGVRKGGKAAGTAALQKVGWAKKGGAARRGRMSNPGLAGHSMGVGYGSGLSNSKYDPKGDYDRMTKGVYEHAMMSGTGLGGKFRSGSRAQSPALRTQAGATPSVASNKNYKQRQVGNGRAGLKNGVGMKSTKF